jgi:hypothetical protein
MPSARAWHGPRTAWQGAHSRRHRGKRTDDHSFLYLLTSTFRQGDNARTTNLSKLIWKGSAAHIGGDMKASAIAVFATLTVLLLPTAGWAAGPDHSACDELLADTDPSGNLFASCVGVHAKAHTMQKQCDNDPDGSACASALANFVAAVETFVANDPGGSLPPGFGCIGDSDCDPSPCLRESCNADSFRCEANPLECTPPDLCTVSVCAEASGECVEAPAVICPSPGPVCNPETGLCEGCFSSQGHTGTGDFDVAAYWCMETADCPGQVCSYAMRPAGSEGSVHCAACIDDGDLAACKLCDAELSRSGCQNVCICDDCFSTSACAGPISIDECSTLCSESATCPGEVCYQVILPDAAGSFPACISCDRGDLAACEQCDAELTRQGCQSVCDGG